MYGPQVILNSLRTRVQPHLTTYMAFLPCHPALQPLPSPPGARIKITRSFLIGGFRRTHSDSSDATSSSSSEEEHRCDAPTLA